MFTGIVEELGTVTALEAGAESARLTVRGEVLRDVRPGDSVAVNGVCLTAVTVLPDGVMTADVMTETLRRTSLRTVAVGGSVNLERAVTAATRLGGHLVQGHVDGVGTVVDRAPGDGCEVVAVEVPEDLARYVVPQGSICLDGVSLTAVSADGVRVVVSLIPETLRRTTLGWRAVGEPVNVEVDVIAKYVERLVAPHRPGGDA